MPHNQPPQKKKIVTQSLLQQNLFASMLWIACGWLMYGMPSAVAQIELLPGSAGRVELTTGQPPTVYINPANSAGVSHNQYSAFNVAKEGVGLDNRTHQAQIILNEVISTQPSNLYGTVEVIGQKADVIIANTAGIYCDGCGFKNVHRAVLTTGKIEFENDAIRGFNVEQGTISIAENGLIDYGSAQIDLIALNAIVTGNIHQYQTASTQNTHTAYSPVNSLNISVGKNTIAYSDQPPSPSSLHQESQESQIDIKHLGGMYAKKIHLVSTAKGIGINSAGIIHAESNLTIKTAKLINAKSGIISSAGDIGVTVDAHLQNDGMLYAAKNLMLLSANSKTSFTNQVGATIYAGKTLQLGHDCQLSAADMCTRNRENLFGSVTINNHGNLLSDQHVYIQADTFNNVVSNTSMQELNLFWYKKETHQELIPGEIVAELIYQPDIKGTRKEHWIRATLQETQYQQAGTLINRPTVIAGKNLSIRTQQGSNTGGTLAASGTVSISALNDFSQSSFTNTALTRSFTVREQSVTTAYRCTSVICPEKRRAEEHRIPEVLGENRLTERMVLESVGGIIQAGLWGNGVEITIGNFVNRGAIEQPFKIDGLNQATQNKVKESLSKRVKDIDFFTRYQLPKNHHGLFISTDGVNTPMVISHKGLAKENTHTSLSTDFIISSITQHINDEAEKTRLKNSPRLGDGLYEKHLVQTQIIEKTGLAWLDSFYTDPATQFKVLMKNALDVTGLKIGVALNTEQQQALTKNIVWLVEKNIAGKNLLVPQLYLAADTEKHMFGGSILGEKVHMHLSSLENKGGMIQAEEQLKVLADNKIANLSGEMGGRNVSLQMPHLMHQTLSSRYGNANDYIDMAHRPALIHGTEDVLITVPESTVLGAGVNVQGSTIRSETGNIKIRSANTINIASLALERKTTQWPKKENFSARYLDQYSLRSSLTANQEVILDAFNDIHLVGVALHGDQLNLTSQHTNVDMRALVLIQTSLEHSKKTYKTWVISSEERSTIDKKIHIAHVNNELIFGKRADILAEKGHIYLADTDLSATKNIHNLASILNLAALSISTLPTQDVEYVQKKSYDSYLGIRFEGHSSVVNAIEHAHTALGAEGSDKAYVRATVMRGAQLAGDMSNIAFGDTIGGSLSFSYEKQKSITDYYTTSDLISTWRAGNISVLASQGDIALNGVNIDSAESQSLISFRAAKKILLSEADETTQWDINSNSEQFTLNGTISANVLMSSAGTGVRLGYHHSKNHTAQTNTRHTPLHMMADRIHLISGEDMHLKGGKVIAKKIIFDIGKILKVESLQDTETSDTREASWGGSFGVDVNATTFLGLNGNVDASTGKNWTRSALTSEQSGFFAESINGKIHGDVRLTGAHLIASRQQVADKLNITGVIHAIPLTDQLDQDGFIVGGGIGIGVNGLPYGNIDFSTPQMMRYQATQNATLAGLQWQASGVVGTLNTDLSSLMKVVKKDGTNAIEISGIFSFTEKAVFDEKTRLPTKPSNNKSQPCCFAPGTLVATPYGQRAIEMLKVGDVVWSKKEDKPTGEVFLAKIIATHQRDDQPIYKLILAQRDKKNLLQHEALFVTPDHPFYVVGRGFIPASQLKVGDTLTSREDAANTVTVVSLTLDRAQSRTHNLSVEVGRTFFVGAFGTWVHNTGDCMHPKWFADKAKENADTAEHYVNHATNHISQASGKLVQINQHVKDVQELLSQKNNSPNMSEHHTIDEKISKHIRAAQMLQNEILEIENRLLDIAIHAQDSTRGSIMHAKKLSDHRQVKASNTQKYLIEAKEHAARAKKFAQQLTTTIEEIDFSGQANASLNALIDKGIPSLQLGPKHTNSATSMPSRPNQYEGVPIKNVTQETFELLMIANDINQKVRKDLPLGAGNQKQDIINSAGLSALRTSIGRKLYSHNKLPKQSDIDAIKVTCAGNCWEHAKLTYSYLATTYGHKHIQLVKALSSDHMFVVLENKNSASGKMVVVDPWAIDGGTHLLEDHAFSVGQVLMDSDHVGGLRTAKLNRQRISFKNVESQFKTWETITKESLDHSFEDLLKEQVERARKIHPANFSSENSIWDQRLTMNQKIIYQVENSDKTFVPFLPDPQRKQRMEVKIGNIKISEAIDNLTINDK